MDDLLGGISEMQSLRVSDNDMELSDDEAGEWETTSDEDSDDSQDEEHPHQEAKTYNVTHDEGMSPLCDSCRVMIYKLPSVS